MVRAQLIERLRKALRDNPVGRVLTEDSPEVPIGRAPETQAYDYSHLLSPAASSGYRLTLLSTPDPSQRHNLHVIVTSAGSRRPLGELYGSHDATALQIGDINLAAEHHNRGLGRAMYEAAMTHAVHAGASRVRGMDHSSSASVIHQRLSAKHGLDYTPSRNPRVTVRPGPYDNRFLPYEYMMKSLTRVYDDPGPRGWKAGAGDVTATDEGSMPVAEVLKLPGLKGEEKLFEQRPSGRYEPDAWRSFASDIRSNGVRQPLELWHLQDGRRMIKEGNHRARAALMAGLSDLPVRVTWFGNSQRAPAGAQGAPATPANRGR